MGSHHTDMDWREGQHQYRYSEYPLYPEHDEDLSFMERAVTIVTNNLSIATVSIPVILLVISIILFAVLFAPSSLIQRVLINTGLVQTAKEARHEGDDDVKSEGDVNVVSDLGDLEDAEGFFESFPNFFSMVSDIVPRVDNMTVPDVLLTRNETIIVKNEALTDIFDTSSLLRSYK